MAGAAVHCLSSCWGLPRKFKTLSLNGSSSSQPNSAPTKKPDSAAKRARQAEKRRVYNKARKSEIRTRMKKVTRFVFQIVYSLVRMPFHFRCVQIEPICTVQHWIPYII
ncbi:unnamed protein product [Ilex paraguariensis]|uniref:30S ribosomal protein S20, chloroplastic n=1 Tax=Ilex paraguariensis TaxID=185542 RepID=A0ABC8UPN9_9AQUA